MFKATALVCLILATDVSAVHGQERVLKGPTCETCTISVTHVATLGDNDRGLVGMHLVGARDARGRYWISYPESGDEVVVFDARGRYLRTFGRRGQGPGEFHLIGQMAADGDDIYLFDYILLRATVVSPDFEVERTFGLPNYPLTAVVLPTGKIVFNAIIASQEKAGLLLHLLSPGGQIERSFGEVGKVFRRDADAKDWRALAVARERDQFWVAPTTEYVVQKWHTSGRMIASLRRTLEWFEPHELGTWPHPKTPPAPLVQSIESDSAGLLYLAVARADEQWYEAVVPDSTWINGYAWTDDWDRLYDTVIEVIDPETAEVLASRQIDQHFWDALGDGYYASYKEAPDGTPQLHVWRVQFTRGPNR